MAAPSEPVEMSTAIRAASKAILRAQNVLEMLQGVCDAAVRGKAMLGAVVFLPDLPSSRLYAVASSGELAHILAKADLSSDPTIPEGRGLVSQAFRTGERCICEDAPNDQRIQPWRHLTETADLGKAAAFPFFYNGQPAGVIAYFFGQQSGELGVEVIEFLGHFADLVPLGMEIAEREERRRLEEDSTNRMARTLAALSATNEAMMRATTRAQLFEQVCEAAVLGGNFASTTILLAESGSEFLHVAAAAGPDAERARNSQLSVMPLVPKDEG